MEVGAGGRRAWVDLRDAGGIGFHLLGFIGGTTGKIQRIGVPGRTGSTAPARFWERPGQIVDRPPSQIKAQRGLSSAKLIRLNQSHDR